MQNLDQIRAAKALESINRNGTQITRQTVSKLPAMILSNGLLAAAAFADERNNEGRAKRAEMQDAMNAVADHLSNPIHGISVLAGKTTAAEMIAALSRAPAISHDLQRAIGEALAFLAYLKRFATKEGDDE